MRPTLIIGLAVGAGIIIGSAVMTLAGGVSSAREILASMGRSDFANACVSSVKGYMKSPSSFRAVEVTERTDPDTLADDLDIAGTIKYQAQNAYGVPVQGIATCGGLAGTISRVFINGDQYPGGRTY